MQTPRKQSPTYAELAARVAELERALAQSFSVKEMDALRDQLTERAARAEVARDTLEWKLKKAMARDREAEERKGARERELNRALDELKKIYDSNGARTISISARPRRLPAPLPVRAQRLLRPALAGVK